LIRPGVWPVTQQSHFDVRTKVLAVWPVTN
jgi:hypothetical protein